MMTPRLDTTKELNQLVTNFIQDIKYQTNAKNCKHPRDPQISLAQGRFTYTVSGLIINAYENGKHGDYYKDQEDSSMVEQIMCDTNKIINDIANKHGISVTTELLHYPPHESWYSQEYHNIIEIKLNFTIKAPRDNYKGNDNG